MQPPYKYLGRIALLLLISYTSVVVLLMVFQRSFIYLPPKTINNNLKEIIVVNKKEKLKIIVANEERKDAIIYFGGNAESVATYHSNFSHHFKDHALYLVNYRGYGGSSGMPSESALYEDALLAYDTLKPKHKNISIIGRSLGSGVATYVASKREVERLILITPFDSVEAVVKRDFTIFPISWMLFDRYNSIGRVQDIKAKTLLLIGGNDTVIPNENSMKLYNAFETKRVTKQLFEGYGHNDIQLAPSYYQVMQNFLTMDD